MNDTYQVSWNEFINYECLLYLPIYVCSSGIVKTFTKLRIIHTPFYLCSSFHSNPTLMEVLLLFYPFFLFEDFKIRFFVSFPFTSTKHKVLIHLKKSIFHILLNKRLLYLLFGSQYSLKILTQQGKKKCKW